MAASNRSSRKRAAAGFALYLVMLIYFLFFAQEMGRTSDEDYRYNLTLFFEIKRFLNNIDYLGWKSVAINVLGNVVAFMPLGYFVPRMTRGRSGLFKTTLLCFDFSLIVEFVQLVTRLGCFDVDDLFLNTIGGLLGCVCYYVIRRIYRQFYSKVI